MYHGFAKTYTSNQQQNVQLPQMLETIYMYNSAKVALQPSKLDQENLQLHIDR